MQNATGTQMPLAQSRLTERLVAFVRDTGAEDLPEATRVSAKYLILDTIGVALAAATRDVGRIITRFALDTSAQPATATIFGTREKASASRAALANGTMANALDYDGGAHLPTHLLPAVFAVAEEHQLSGAEALTAFILAFEASNKLTKVIESRRRSGGSSPTRRGWWHVGLVGPVGAALAASRLMGLDPRQTAVALGIATASSAGFRRNMGTMSKALSSGNAAAAGIDAAGLAARGFTADPEILEAPMGFVSSVALADERDITAITEGLGRPFALEGWPRIKRIPAVTPAHVLIDAAIELRDRDDVVIEEIDSIRAAMTPLSLFRTEVRDAESAGFCGPFLIALALTHGAVTLDHYRQEVFEDPQIRALMARVENAEPSEMAGQTLIITLKDGREIASELKPGGQHLTDAGSVLDKFGRCAAKAVSKPAADRIRDVVLELENQTSLGPLMDAVGGRA
ncbi:MAG: MmgE/PrpD family protein [Alphaproteobacteria bacterium]|nr:MmgE/PrpD family protein [Alphaproteobacteria bacterium]